MIPRHCSDLCGAERCIASEGVACWGWDDFSNYLARRWSANMSVVADNAAVLVRDLKSEFGKTLNGLLGKVQRRVGERYVVLLEIRESYLVKPENLLPVDHFSQGRLDPSQGQGEDEVQLQGPTLAALRDRARAIWEVEKHLAAGTCITCEKACDGLNYSAAGKLQHAKTGICERCFDAAFEGPKCKLAISIRRFESLSVLHELSFVARELVTTKGNYLAFKKILELDRDMTPAA
jgi:hypothetical protein